MLDKLSPVEQQLVVGILLLIFSAFMSFIGMLIGHSWKRVKQDINEIKAHQSGCSTTLQGRFADKQETKETFEKHERRLDKHGERITKVEGKVGL